MMNHEHVGPIDVACTGCIREANGGAANTLRKKTIAGLLLLIALVIGGTIVLACYLKTKAPHLN